VTRSTASAREESARPAPPLPADRVPVSPGHGLAMVRAMRRDPLTLLQRLNTGHSTVVRLRVPRPLFLVTEPDAIQEAFTHTHRGYEKGWAHRADPQRPGIQPLSRALGQGLLTSDAHLHRRQRRLIQPLFHRERIDGYAGAFVDLAAAAAARWRDGDVRDLHRDMSDLTLAIVARTVFDVELDAEIVRIIRGAVEHSQNTLRRSTSAWGRVLDRLPVPSTRRWNASAREMGAGLAKMIASRRAAGVPGTDLLSLLLAARDEETGEPMPDALVRDEALTLLLAGHETTANALAWALHLLAEHPREQQRVRDELTGLGRQPTAADLPRLRYTGAVVHETMRLYPPAWTILRHLATERPVGGYRLPAGSTLMVSPWVVHRDPRWWPEPDRFRPARWLSTGVPPHRYAYFPFGGGPRQCIGNDFALMEATLVLATVLRAWRVGSVPGTPPVRPLPLVTLRPRHGVWLMLRRVAPADR
jgi:cytochrome P450